MGLSLPAIGSFQTFDQVAPKAPTFVEARQIDNAHIRCAVRLPDQDANGEPLSGLTRLYLAVAPFGGGVNPFEELSSQEILDYPQGRVVTQAVTPQQAGETVEVDAPILALGAEHALAAICSDAE